MGGLGKDHKLIVFCSCFIIDVLSPCFSSIERGSLKSLALNEQLRSLVTQRRKYYEWEALPIWHPSEWSQKIIFRFEHNLRFKNQIQCRWTEHVLNRFWDGLSLAWVTGSIWPAKQLSFIKGNTWLREYAEMIACSERVFWC